MVYSKTIFHPFTMNLNIPNSVKLDMFLFFNSRLTECERSYYKIKNLAKVPDDPNPTYTFAHFLFTHDPFRFDAEGKCLTYEEINSRDYKLNYKEQVTFANKKIKELIDTILEKSKDNPPIIILQADEGPYPARYSEDLRNFDFNKASAEDVKEKMAILNAYYFPDRADHKVSDFITPVNTFRYIFSYYFGINLPQLPNISYLSNMGKPFNFIQIERDQK